MCGGGYLFDKVWWWWIFYKQLSSLGLAKTYTDLQIRNFQLPPNGKRVRLPVGESVYVERNLGIVPPDPFKSFDNFIKAQ